jgi:hypothetical protein
MRNGARLSSRAPLAIAPCARVRHARQAQFAGQAQSPQPHALPQQQRAVAARAAVASQDAQAQALAG